MVQKPMKPKQLAKARDRIKFDNKGLAFLLRVDVRTIQRWLSGDREIPGPVETSMKCFVDLKKHWPSAWQEYLENRGFREVPTISGPPK